jgi:hypothetical protein
LLLPMLYELLQAAVRHFCNYKSRS